MAALIRMLAVGFTVVAWQLAVVFSLKPTALLVAAVPIASLMLTEWWAFHASEPRETNERAGMGETA